MLLQIGLSDYEEVTYGIDYKNYSILEDKNINVKKYYKDDDFLNRLINLIFAEREVWGRKDIYLSFEEIVQLIRSAKCIYNDDPFDEFVDVDMEVYYE